MAKAARSPGPTVTMRREADANDHTIRLPVHILERERKIARAESRLTGILGRSPTDMEIAEEAGCNSRRWMPFGVRPER
jgi:DNA-directed RNA polymerase sigma subunit (sigma70/sigma32)